MNLDKTIEKYAYSLETLEDYYTLHNLHRVVIICHDFRNFSMGRLFIGAD